MFIKIVNILHRTNHLTVSIFIFIALIFSAILDLLIIATAGPIIFLFLKGEADKNIHFIEKFISSSYISLELVVTLLLLFKVAYQLLAYNWMFKTTFKIYNKISLDVMQIVFSTKSNNIKANKLSVSITSEIEEFVKTVILPSYQMLSETTLIILALIYLSFINLTLTISFICLGIVFVVIYNSFISLKLIDLGLITRNTRLELIESTQFIAFHNQELQSIKAVDFFKKKISKIILKFSSSSAKYQYLLSLPRFIIETLGLIGLLILAMIAPFMKIEGVELIIFGVATLRILPAFQRVYVSTTQIKYGKRTIDFLNSIETSLRNDENNEFMKILRIICFEKTDAGYACKFKKDQSIYDQNFSIGINYIVGKSGSGKSTFINILYNHIYNTKTNISCALIQQGTTIFPGSIYDNIILDREYNQNRLDELIKIFFKSETDRLSPKEILSINVGDLGKGLSGGQIQRIVLVRTFLLHNDIYFIDEGLAGLNHDMKNQVIKDINKWLINNNSTAIIITHDTMNSSKYSILDMT
jgi:ABC-type transport system involved in cytochrome bd biosynthesis fused ATPase/permease subunit